MGALHMLTRPHPDLGDRAAIDIVTPSNLGMVAQVIAGGQPHANAPEVVPPRPISEEVRQSVRRLMESAVALDGA